MRFVGAVGRSVQSFGKGKGRAAKKVCKVIIVIIIIIIIIINCNWVVTRWQWLFYVYTKY